MFGRLPAMRDVYGPAHPSAPGPPYPVASDDGRLPRVRARLARRLGPVLGRLGLDTGVRDEILDAVARFELRWHDGHADAHEDTKRPERPEHADPT